MKKIIILGIFIFAIIFIASCTQQTTICGDGFCDKTESCACADCANTDFCQIKNVTQNCDDANECTIDSFNPATNSCVHELKANCCGNNKCEISEYECNLTSYETNCGKDCGLKCPPKLVVYKDQSTKTDDQFSYSCADQNCEQTGPNVFRMKGVSSIQTFISNIGEQTTDIVTSGFVCKRDDTKIALNDYDTYYGTIFRDFFNDGLEKVDGINSRISQANYATYNFKVNITNSISPTPIKCTLVLTSVLYLQNVQDVSITLY